MHWGVGGTGMWRQSPDQPQPPDFQSDVHKNFIPQPVLDVLAVKRL